MEKLREAEGQAEREEKEYENDGNYPELIE